MDAFMKAVTRFAFGWILVLPLGVLAQPPVTSPEQLAATRELFNLHAHGGHRMPSDMRYSAFDQGSEFYCADQGSTGERVIHYPLSVPPHLFIESVQVWGYDDAATDRMRVRVLVVCQTNGGLSPPQSGVLAEATTQGNQSGPVYFDVPVGSFGSGPGCARTVEVRLASPGQLCIGSGRTITRVRAQAFNLEHIFRDGFVPRVELPTTVQSAGAQP